MSHLHPIPTGNAGHATLADALAAAQLEMPDPTKTKKNPGIGNRYAGLDDVLRVARPVLSRHGIALAQYVDVLDNGMTVLVTRLWVGDGQGTNELRGRFPLVLDDSLFDEKERKRTNRLQRQGIVLSYYKRYALEAILAVAATEDTDGDTGREETRPKSAPPAEHPTWWQDREAFTARLVELGTSFAEVDAACVRRWGVAPRPGRGRSARGCSSSSPTGPRSRCSGCSTTPTTRRRPMPQSETTPWVRVLDDHDLCDMLRVVLWASMGEASPDTLGRARAFEGGDRREDWWVFTMVVRHDLGVEVGDEHCPISLREASHVE